MLTPIIKPHSVVLEVKHADGQTQPPHYVFIIFTFE